MSLGELNKSFGAGRVRSAIHKDLQLLDDEGFIQFVRKGRKGAKVFDITIKGVLASLFVNIPRLKPTEKTLEKWRRKDWGPEYKDPFRMVRNLNELIDFVKQLYLHASLEGVDVGHLKRMIRNPEEVLTLLQNPIIEFSVPNVSNIDSFVPDSTVTHIGKNPKTGGPLIFFTVIPSEKTMQILKENRQDIHSASAILRAALEAYRMKLRYRGEELPSSFYSEQFRLFTIVGFLPEQAVAFLRHPHQIIDYLKKSYVDLINLFSDEKFVCGDEASMNFRFVKYDPEKRELFPLSQEETRNRAIKILEKIKAKTKST
jgi:hypothetical protein